jgi:hypothetical protein
MLHLEGLARQWQRRSGASAIIDGPDLHGIPVSQSFVLAKPLRLAFRNGSAIRDD